MSFDEQPYDKEDHDLHDACEEIARLRKNLGEREAELEKSSCISANRLQELAALKAELARVSKVSTARLNAEILAKSQVSKAQAELSERDGKIEILQERSSCSYCRRFGPPNKKGEHYFSNMGASDQEIWLCESTTAPAIPEKGEGG